jgi:uncharacterized protein (DUF58 family)
LKTSEILKKVKLIEIKTNRLVDESLAGEYLSVFKGRGMEFSEVREYQLGDDIRTIDWNVTSRMGSLYVKKYVEERELTVLLMVDQSASMRFGTVEKSKAEIAAEISAILAFSAIKNNDRVGLVLFTDRIEKFIPPKKGKSHVLRVIRDVLYSEPVGKRTDLSMALEYLLRVLTKRGVVFLISDFFMRDGFDKPLKIAKEKHDLIPVEIYDAREETLVPSGLIRFEDLESGEDIVFDTSSGKGRKYYEQLTRLARTGREKDFRSYGIDPIVVKIDEPYERPLVEFFRKRAMKIRH